MAVAHDLTNARFGKLTVIKRAKNHNNRVMWECLCDCGNKTTVAASYLINGDTKSCGCLKHKHATNFNDLTGQKFGRLTVIDYYGIKNNKVYWNCRCSCGNKKIVSGYMLTSGRTKSCGCLKKDVTTRKDLKGEKFGLLEVISLDEKRTLETKKKAFWICKCACGDTVSVSANNLLSLHTNSCGCLKKSTAEIMIESILVESGLRKGIDYDIQKKFSNLKSDKGYFLRYDFIIYNPNGINHVLIECNGMQHYKPVLFFGEKNSLENFKKQKNHDFLKSEYAKNNNMKLIEIPYKIRSKKSMLKILSKNIPFISFTNSLKADKKFRTIYSNISKRNTSYNKEKLKKICIKNYQRRKRKVNKLNENKEVIERFNSVKEAAFSVGKSSPNIVRAMKTGTKAYGYYWEYAENKDDYICYKGGNV